MTDISLIICSRNRAATLRECLASLDAQVLRRFDVEVVVVDSASDDDTGKVIAAYAEGASTPVRCLRAELPGVARAQNLALQHATGELLVFTDDDCRLSPDYFDTLAAHFDRNIYDYGGGRILHGEADADDRMAATDWLGEEEVMVLPPRSMLLPGTIQGANMFFMRRVFEHIGGFSELLGPGSVVGSGADTEFSMRACLAGFRGVCLGQVRIFHHHGNRAGSAEAARVVLRYARGRGGFFASLVAQGLPRGFDYWKRWMGAAGGRPNQIDVVRLINEFRGAADFLEALLQCPKPARPGWRRDYPEVMPASVGATSPAAAEGSEPAAPSVS